MTAVLIPRVNLARLAAGPVAFAVALGALAVAQGPGRFTTYAGRSGLAATLTTVAGLALVVAGVVTAFGGRAGRIGELATLAGSALVRSGLRGMGGGATAGPKPGRARRWAHLPAPAAPRARLPE